MQENLTEPSLTNIKQHYKTVKNAMLAGAFASCIPISTSEGKPETTTKPMVKQEFEEI
jgi:hypothetical protein